MNLDSEQMLAVLNALPDPVFVLTESGLYAGLYGLSDPEYYHDGHGLVGRLIDDVLPAEVASWVMDHLRQSLAKNGLIKVEYPLSADQVKGLENQAGPDHMLWFEGHIQPFPELINGERAVIWVARNITRRKALEEELLEASCTDPLTHAANRRRLLDELHNHFGEFKRYGHPTALIMFDLDHFKKINDQYGHLAGDEVLRRVCAICRESLRENDLLARFGGEEFVIVLPSTHAGEALHTAERIRELSALSIGRDFGFDQNVTISLGVSEFLVSDPEYAKVLQRIDEAVYQAKSMGRNRVVVYGSAER